MPRITTLRPKRIKRIHVNKHIISSNKKNNQHEPPLRVKTSDGNYAGHRIDILDEEGEVIAYVVYSKGNPLSCGAEVWIETHNEVRVREEDA
jgi:hypothetical protein